jgi:hypothetical protein
VREISESQIRFGLGPMNDISASLAFNAITTDQKTERLAGRLPRRPKSAFVGVQQVEMESSAFRNGAMTLAAEGQGSPGLYASPDLDHSPPGCRRQSTTRQMFPLNTAAPGAVFVLEFGVPTGKYQPYIETVPSASVADPAKSTD